MCEPISRVRSRSGLSIPYQMWDKICDHQAAENQDPVLGKDEKTQFKKYDRDKGRDEKADVRITPRNVLHPLDSQDRSRVLMFSSEVYDGTLHLSFPAIMIGDRFRV
jgi:hypothetical protein